MNIIIIGVVIVLIWVIYRCTWDCKKTCNWMVSKLKKKAGDKFEIPAGKYGNGYSIVVFVKGSGLLIAKVDICSKRVFVSLYDRVDLFYGTYYLLIGLGCYLALRDIRAYMSSYPKAPYFHNFDFKN